MKRRSLLTTAGLNDSLNASIPIDEVDEEAERRGRVRNQRRHSMALVKANASNLIGNESVVPITATNSGYSPAQLADHYANCMKLSAENKISVKNAFSLHMIDYMAEMVKKKAAGMDNFQTASCALDASAKIYGYRVDALHSDTLKLAGGVGKTADEAGLAAGGDDGERNEDGDGGEGQGKKARRKKNAGLTIERNLNNINLNKLDLEFDVDPLFKKTSSQFDSGGGGGKFLCNLLTRDDTCQMLLDSNAIQFMPGETVAATQDAINNNFSWPKSWPMKLKDENVICPEFVTFRFSDWSLENDDLSSSMYSSQKSDKDDKIVSDENEHVFDIQAAMEEADNDDALGSDFVGCDDGGMDEDGDLFVDDKRDEFRAGPLPNKGVVTNADYLKRHLSYIPSEYSYFDTGKFNQWAGPQHWKFSRPKFSSVTLPGTAKPKSAKPKELTPHDFKSLYSGNFEEEFLNFDSVQKAISVPKVPVRLQPKTMNTWTDDKLMLPGDLTYNGKDFAILYHCDFHITSKPIKQLSVDDSVTDYNFNNDNDVSNFCPAGASNDDGGYEDEFGGPDGGGDDDIFTSGDQLNQSLVAAPNRVEKILIGYAKQAKKMDMRKLKSIEWDLLNDEMLDNKENEDSLNKDEKETIDEPVKAECTFSSLYKNLNVSKLMPPQMAENLSVPLAFVALLHLCNENNLSLKARSDFSDISILRG